MLNFFRVRKQLSELNDLLDAMGDKLHDHQVQIEVMGEALTQKDNDMLAFVHRLHETMGGNQKLTCEGDAMARLRVLRSHSDQYIAIMDVVNGNYCADFTLRKRIACSLGCAQFDTETIVKRASHLAGELPKNIELTRELGEKEQEIAELNEELDNLVGGKF